MAAAALVLTGCAQAPEVSAPPEPRGMGAEPPYGEPGTEEPEAEQPEATEEPEPTEEETSAELGDEEVYGPAEQTEHDLLHKDIGQLAGLVSGYSDEPVAQLTVTEIVVDFECTAQAADPPQNGHYIGLHFEVETFLPLGSEYDTRLYMASRDFLAWDEAGEPVSDPVPAGTCLERGDAIPSPIGPSEVLAGWIVLDVPTTSGTVGYLPFGPEEGGWEWQYGQ